MGPAGGRVELPAGGVEVNRAGGPPTFLGASTGLFALVFLTYGFGAILSWSSFGSAVGPAFFHPSAGVAVASMLLSRRSLWPAVAAAIMAGEVLVASFFGNSLAQAAGFGVANVVEALVGASLVRAWCGRRPDLRYRRDLALFIAGACLLGPLYGGLIGGTVSAVDDQNPWLTLVVNWWSGNALGILVIGAPILLWSKQSYIVRQRPWETLGVMAVTAGLSIAAFWSDAPPSVLILPVLAWAALRLDMIGAAMAGAVAAFLANIMTTRGNGWFALGESPGSKVALTQVFVATIVVVAMLVAQEAAGRMSAVREREAERRERMRMESLAALAQRLSAGVTPRDIGQTLVAHLLNEAGASALNLGLVSPDRKTLKWIVMEGHPRSVVAAFGDGIALSERTATTDVLRTGQPVIIATAAEYAARYPEKAKWQQLTRRESVVAWPLKSGDTPVGVLLLAWADRQRLNTAQLAYISAVATMVSQALVRAQIYADEHARAAVLQSAVLPTGPTDTVGLDVGVTYEPADVAQGLGGDWYDVMALPKNRAYLAVGDVVGHGLPAVEDMAQLRSAGRALAYQGLPPGQLLAELNGFTRHASQGKFATMAIAVYDPAEGSLTYCVAGHPPPLLRRAATGEVARLSQAHGPVLGPVQLAAYSQDKVRVAPGDILVMYTDGLVERRGMDLDRGIARAATLVADWDASDDVSDYCDMLKDQLAPRPRADDVCIIAVRFGG